MQAIVMCAKCDKLERQQSGHLRFATIAWLIAVPLMYAIVVWVWSNRAYGPVRDWRGPFAIPVIVPVLFLGMMWLVTRIDLKNLRVRLHPDGIQTTTQLDRQSETNPEIE